MLPEEVAISMQAVRVQMVSQAARITAHAAVMPPIITEALREARTAARITTVKDSPEAVDTVADRPIRRPTHAAMTTEHTVRLRAAAMNRRRAAVKLTAPPRAAEDSPEADIAAAVELTAAAVVAVVVFPVADAELC